MIERFKSLTPREQALIGFGAVFLSVALIWQVIWSPLQQARMTQTTEISRLDALIHVAAQARGATAPRSLDTTPPSQRITQTAAAAGIALTRLEPEGQLFRVTVAELAFDTAITWIATLDADHGLIAREVEMTRRPLPGVVALTLALEPYQ